MSLLHFNRAKRFVKLGGRAIGPFLLGGRWYEIRKLTLWQFLDWQEACREVERALGPFEFGPDAALPVLRALLPVLLGQPIRPRDLRRVTPDQVIVATAEFGLANDIEKCVEAFTPKGNEKGVGFDVLVCQIAEHFHVEPQAVLAWPLIEILAVLDALKEAHPDPAQQAELAKYGLDGEGYEVVS